MSQEDESFRREFVKKLFFKEGVKIRFKREFRVRSEDGLRWIMTINEGERGTIYLSFMKILYIKLEQPRFSISVIKLSKVPLEELEIVQE